MSTSNQLTIAVLTEPRKRSIGTVKLIVFLNQSRRNKFSPFALRYTFLAYCQRTEFTILATFTFNTPLVDVIFHQHMIHFDDLPGQRIFLTERPQLELIDSSIYLREWEEERKKVGYHVISWVSKWSRLAQFWFLVGWEGGEKKFNTTHLAKQSEQN